MRARHAPNALTTQPGRHWRQNAHGDAFHVALQTDPPPEAVFTTIYVPQQTGRAFCIWTSDRLTAAGGDGEWSFRPGRWVYSSTYLSLGSSPHSNRCERLVTGWQDNADLFITIPLLAFLWPSYLAEAHLRHSPPAISNAHSSGSNARWQRPSGVQRTGRPCWCEWLAEVDLAN
jgi:hypothetical protein